MASEFILGEKTPLLVLKSFMTNQKFEHFPSKRRKDKFQQKYLQKMVRIEQNHVNVVCKWP